MVLLKYFAKESKEVWSHEVDIAKSLYFCDQPHASLLRYRWHSKGEKTENKNRLKAIFNWAAKGLFFLRGGGGYTHSGYHKTLSATIACDRTSSETET